MDDPRELEFIRNYKPSIEDLKNRPPADGCNRIEHWDQIYYPKEFVDWLCSLTRNMWGSSDQAYEYWIDKIKNKNLKQ